MTEFGSKPYIPPINDEGGVVEWFLQYDDKIADFRTNFPGSLEMLRTETLGILQQHQGGPALQRRVRELSDEYTATLGRVASQVDGGETPPDEELMTESAIAAKIRILGYFLLRKHNIQPE